MIDSKERLKKEKEVVLSIFEGTDKELFGYALKTVDGSRDALGDLLYILSELPTEANTAVLALVTSCGRRISDLEKTIETYEEALKVLGKET